MTSKPKGVFAHPKGGQFLELSMHIVGRGKISVSVGRGGYWYFYWIEIVDPTGMTLLVEDKDGKLKGIDRMILKLPPECIPKLKEIFSGIEKNDTMWREMSPKLREPMNLTIDPQLRKELERGPDDDK